MSPHYQPANYPVLRQALISALFLAPLALGVWMVSSSQATKDAGNESTGNIVIEPLPTSSDIEPLDLHPEEIEAPAAMVYDITTDSVLFAKNETDIHSLASITKLMTALLVTELIDSHEVVITVTEDAVRQYGYSGLRVGEQVTADNLNQYALLSSSNDAAYALAYSVGEKLYSGEGSAAFVDAMNVRAQELGLSHTAFQNPTGLDISTIESGALGTAQDVTELMSHLVTERGDLLASTRNNEELIHNLEGGYHRAVNTNPLVESIPNLLGSKTGYTDIAGGNLVVAFDVGYNRPIVVTVLNSSWSGRFRDVERLVAETVQHFQSDISTQ